MPNARFFSFLLAASVLLSGGGQWLAAESKSVTVGPSNDSPTVTFHSNTPGETHSLTVGAASGCRFVSGPSLGSNPSGLWSSGGGNSFNMLSLGDENEGAGEPEVEAKIDGTIRRQPTGGGGGGGPPPEIDVEVDLSTKYFSMEFTEPFDSRPFVHEEEENVPLSMTLLNASGEPSGIGDVQFTFDNGNASLDSGSKMIGNGMVEATFTAADSASAGDECQISADATGVDITDGETASGQNTSDLLPIFKVDLITPAGNEDNDPVASAIEGGDGTGSVPDGANEFTFSDDSTGVLTIPFKASMAGISDHANDIKDKVVFTVENVWQAPSWDPENGGGKASLSIVQGTFLEAEATFAGLPSDNSDFGTKTVSVEYAGNVVEEKQIEIFFPRDDANHPGPGAGSKPNWFFYYMQTVSLLGPSPHVEYDNSSGGNRYEPSVNTIYLDDSATTSYNAPYGTNNPLEGIDHFAWVAIHESQHYDDFVVF